MWTFVLGRERRDAYALALSSDALPLSSTGLCAVSFVFFHEKGSVQGQRGRGWQVIRITAPPY